ncbi:MAG: HDOD domain-containing protein [Candidatus Aminicenantes bacterium]|nr:HDOD domain-containing protein [Candidatus Aminicenantes bacterium]NIM83564.1 HDOD domain-containing protein [Candidatus Aminicenantes bacterium]NIN22964.1 HDOD domain-containing protein [Candidatus Aminicenantes bacterium]NIN46701.1 HDOD domain-containing protein [Candidatus Aminicenantes bacterium]NIN89607.1 HDOD domain-containing protein [Candidatus Aminicenantes bacterium]
MTTIMGKAGDVVAKIGELPPIPAVILESMKLLNDPSSTVKKIQEQILLDQALTAFILKLANSALYALRKEVSTVSYAINLMGYNTARSILIAYLSKNLYSTKGNKLIQSMLWKHSLSSGVFGKKIAEHLEKVDPEEAFISSLLHDIGKGVLLKNKTENFEEIVQLIYIENMSSTEAERKVLGFTHVEAGYLLMKNWRFSDTIVETVTYHHNLQEYNGNNLLVPIVSLANKMSHLNNYTFDKREEELLELNILDIPGADMEEIRIKAIEQIENYLEIF